MDTKRPSIKKGVVVENTQLTANAQFYNDTFTYFPGSKGNFYFDIKAVRKHDSKVCVFQVTTRTHTEIKRRLSYAKTFYLDFYILYVRPDLTGYILKYTESSGSQGLCFTDMQKIKAIEKDKPPPVI